MSSPLPPGGPENPPLPEHLGALPTWEPQPICWATLTGDAALLAHHDLDEWVRWAVTRYALDHRTVPPCWYAHGALVEELSALHTGWQSAHSPTAPGNAPLDWHTMFAAARQRLGEWVARTGCRPGEHRDDHPPQWANQPGQHHRAG